MTCACPWPARARRAGIVLMLISGVFARPAQAQSAADCRTPRPAGIGFALGRSLPYVELASGTVTSDGSGPVSVGSGTQVAGRVEIPVTGPLHLRVEGAGARWNVRQQRYASDGSFRVVGDESIDRLTARHLTALVGVRTGRAPTCAYVAAGVGLHAIGFHGASVRGPAAAIAAGMDLPTGARGAIQLDATVHLIRTRNRAPIAMSDVPALSLLAGWMYRF